VDQATYRAGLTKMNVNGVVAKTQEKGVVGTICRDDQGLFLGASAVVYDGILDPATLEALGSSAPPKKPTSSLAPPLARSFPPAAPRQMSHARS
jgi:hypothetical protein